MIDYEICRKILEQEGGKYSDEQIKVIADLLWEYAQLNVDLYLNQNNYDNEACSTDGQG